MRTKMIAGNWKMNLNATEAKELLMHMNQFVITYDQKSEVVLFPPSIYLHEAVEIYHHNQMRVGAQDVSPNDNGAFTGDISAEMLKSLELDYVLVGHSERREYHNESDELLKLKVNQVIKNNLQPIFCCGETLQQREKGKTIDVIEAQITNVLFELSAEDFSKVVIAYEPVWAIGTGETASPSQAQEVHANIRKMISKKYGNDVAESTTILYGGSVNIGNARDLFQMEDIDGGLIGGASLKFDDFKILVKTLDSVK